VSDSCYGWQTQVLHHSMCALRYPRFSIVSDAPRQVRAKDVLRVQLAMGTIHKAHMDSLKKKEKTKKTPKKPSADVS
jgi:hypothetical protein